MTVPPEPKELHTGDICITALPQLSHTSLRPQAHTHTRALTARTRAQRIQRQTNTYLGGGWHAHHGIIPILLQHVRPLTNQPCHASNQPCWVVCPSFALKSHTNSTHAHIFLPRPSCLRVGPPFSPPEPALFVSLPRTHLPPHPDSPPACLHYGDFKPGVGWRLLGCGRWLVGTVAGGELQGAREARNKMKRAFTGLSWMHSNFIPIHAPNKMEREKQAHAHRDTHTRTNESIHASTHTHRQSQRLPISYVHQHLANSQPGENSRGGPRVARVMRREEDESVEEREGNRKREIEARG